MRVDTADLAKVITGVCDLGAAARTSSTAHVPRDHQYLTLGRFTATPAGRARATTPDSRLYRSIDERTEDVLTVEDYVSRSDADWFWCSRALGVQNPTVRRLSPRKYHHSDVYRRIVTLDRRYGLSTGPATSRGGRPRSR